MPTKISEQPLSRKANRIAVSAFFFIQGFIFASWASRIPNIQQKLQLSEAGLGSVLFALPLGLMVSLPISGWMVSRFGSRKMILMATPVYASVLPLLSLAEEIWHLSALLFLFGLTTNLVNLANNTQAIGVEELYQRTIMSSLHGLWSLAGFLAAAFGTYMVSLSISPLVHFIICAGLCILILSAFFKYSIPADAHHENQPIFVLPDKNLLKLGIVGFCSMICEGTMFDWSGIYFNKVVHAPKDLITLGYVAFMSTMAGGRFAGDWLVARLGTKRLIQLNGAAIVMGLGLSVAFPHIVTATIGFLLVGLGVSTVVPLVFSTAGRSKTMSAGMALAAVSSTSFLGFLLGPPLIGFIAEAVSLRLSFALVAILGIVTIILISRIRIQER